jgi:hypothetical protein
MVNDSPAYLNVVDDIDCLSPEVLADYPITRSRKGIYTSIVDYALKNDLSNDTQVIINVNNWVSEEPISFFKYYEPQKRCNVPAPENK